MRAQFEAWWAGYRDGAGAFVRAHELAEDAWADGHWAGVKLVLRMVVVPGAVIAAVLLGAMAF